jgi:geranylgeranyl pyrophosphate synthase
LRASHFTEDPRGETVTRDAINDQLHALVGHASHSLLPSVEYALMGGKRARGLLLLAVGEPIDLPRELLVRAAACVELLHAATLVQDDIFDDSRVRRGRPTVACTFGCQTATLASDWMLAEAIRRAYGISPQFGEALLVCSQRMMEAEAGESSPIAAVPAGRDLEALRTRAVMVAEGKTGELFALAMQAPYLIAGHAAAARRLSASGLRLGVAFQYLDDTLDLYGHRHAMGKDPGRDMATQLYTMPLVDALSLLEAQCPDRQFPLSEPPFPALLLRLQATSTRKHLLAHGRALWQEALTHCSQALPSASLVPQLLSGLIHEMLPDQFHIPPHLRSDTGRQESAAS